MNTSEASDHEFGILESIYRQREKRPVRQRDLAQTAGISLGMTNVILRKLAQKGWVLIRKVNSRNIQYAVSPSGIEEIASRSFKFLKKTVRNVAYYKDILESFLLEERKNGIQGMQLVGKSDFDFVLEHLCRVHDIEFCKSDAPNWNKGWLVVYSEDYHDSEARGEAIAGEPQAFLHDILISL